MFFKLFFAGADWIKPCHPYGWVHWYCDYYEGKRCDDDERQIKRWGALAGPKGRFMRFLVTQCVNKDADFDDINVSPVIRQTLQHWGYVLTKEDFDVEVKRRKSAGK